MKDGDKEVKQDPELYVYSDGKGGVSTSSVTQEDLRGVLSGRLPTSRSKQREIIGVLLNARGVNLGTILDQYANILTTSDSDKMRLTAGDRLLELLGVTGKEEGQAGVTVNITPIDTQKLSDDDVRRQYQQRMLAKQRGVDESEVPVPMALPAFEQVVDGSDNSSVTVQEVER